MRSQPFSAKTMNSIVNRVPLMNRFVIESWLLLIQLEFVMKFRGFHALHGLVHTRCVQPTAATRPSSELLCHAMDLACVFYFKRVLCLQRSAAATLLLRRYGWHAEMVTGIQILPFTSHAWVEIYGTVVNDKPYVRDIYQVLERC